VVSLPVLILVYVGFGADGDILAPNLGLAHDVGC